MQRCTLCKKVKIVHGSYEDYKQLAQYHYRDNGPGQFTSIYALKPAPISGWQKQTIGVIVYSTPTPGLQLRRIATDNFFIGFDQSTQLALLNKNVRRISRVIIEPRFRGLGLAARLVRETMPRMNFPIIEAAAVMGVINPFFEKAGMKAYRAPEKEHNIRFKEALSAVGIEQELFFDPVTANQKIDRLCKKRAEFIEQEIRRFLRSYSDRRYSRPSLKRTAFILNKLTTRPMYYIWFNPTLANCVERLGVSL